MASINAPFAHGRISNWATAVKKLCNLKVDFSDCDQDEVFNSLDVRYNSNGEKYHVLAYNLNMTVMAEGLEWEFRFQNQVRGRVQTHVDYE